MTINLSFFENSQSFIDLRQSNTALCFGKLSCPIPASYFFGLPFSKINKPVAFQLPGAQVSEIAILQPPHADRSAVFHISHILFSSYQSSIYSDDTL